MTVQYDNFAKTFASSRKNMKWAELEYFFSLLKKGSILDIWCWSGRLLEQYNKNLWWYPDTYIWVDLSQGLLDEAAKSFPDMNFRQWDMLYTQDICEWQSFDDIFLIASFHHLRTTRERQSLLKQLYLLLNSGWKIYMTNWALNSDFNKEKYISSYISWSENELWWWDYSIKIWKDFRYYHCFTILELNTLATQAGFKVLENRLFDGGRNIITILKK